LPRQERSFSNVAIAVRRQSRQGRHGGDRRGSNATKRFHDSLKEPASGFAVLQPALSLSVKQRR